MHGTDIDRIINSVRRILRGKIDIEMRIQRTAVSVQIAVPIIVIPGGRQHRISADKLLVISDHIAPHLMAAGKLDYIARVREKPSTGEVSDRVFPRALPPKSVVIFVL